MGVFCIFTPPMILIIAAFILPELVIFDINILPCQLCIRAFTLPLARILIK